MTTKGANHQDKDSTGYTEPKSNRAPPPRPQPGPGCGVFVPDGTMIP